MAPPSGSTSPLDGKETWPGPPHLHPRLPHDVLGLRVEGLNVVCSGDQHSGRPAAVGGGSR